jgi:hypothetical protein
MFSALDTLELTVKRDMERERLHPVEVAELANLIPEVTFHFRMLISI